ncbi:MAG: HAMP domain-containing sensor histidine kinase [Melioribacteraceae bacterium]|jgi:signal transduction histidine kinase|nr:MAG: HAMP domain-containing sensor histidine kinase [Melioribacteraceae bacterium]
MLNNIKKINSNVYFILVFIFAQLAWMALLGLWIYWYVSNSIIFERVGDQLSPQIKIDGPSIFLFVGGIVLIVAIAFGMSVIFRNLNVQLRLTRLYDNFIANVTHELKSPLASIQLYLETIDSRELSPENKKRFIDYMIKDAERLNNLINSILEISRLEQKKISNEYRVYNSSEVIKSLVEQSAAQFQLPQNSLSIMGDSEAEIVIDKNALKIVLDNLIDNAIKYSPNVLHIGIKLFAERKRFIIEFSDKGIGIDQEQLKKIFKKFYRVYASNIPNVKGTGLGLYWVNEILKSHGGKITCYSEGINKGTTFKIELPIHKHYKKMFTRKLLKLTKKRELIESSESQNE